MFPDAGCSHELIAAGYLHDVVEDCDYTWDQLEEKIGNHHVVELVKWVTEPNRVSPDGKKLPWEVRNGNYLERIRNAPVEALTLSCADKTANIWNMFMDGEGLQGGRVYQSGPSDAVSEV